MQHWNDSGVHITNLKHGEVVHTVHLDANLNVSSSAEGTVLVGMMLESTLYVNNDKGKSGDNGSDSTAGSSNEESTAVDPIPGTAVPMAGATSSSTSVRAANIPARTQPPLGLLTFVGLVSDYDVVVADDQSVVITDLYCEQLKVGHLVLTGTGKGLAPGRVTIQGVKSGSYTAAWATVDDYYGSLLYSNSFFMEKSYPQWQVNVKGSREFNLTMLANAFDATNAKYLDINRQPGSAAAAGGDTSGPGALGLKLRMGLGSLLDSGAGLTNLIANAASNFTDLDLGQTRPPLRDQVGDKTLWHVHVGLDDFRMLGALDLALNHPNL